MKIGRHICKYKNKTYIISQIKDTESNLEDFTKYSESEKNKIKKSFHFRYLLGMPNNTLKSLVFRKYKNGFKYITSERDDKIFCWDDLPDKLVKDIFEDWWNIDKMTKKMFKNINLINFRFKLEETINRISKDYSWISIFIIQRIRNSM